VELHVHTPIRLHVLCFIMYKDKDTFHVACSAELLYFYRLITWVDVGDSFWLLFFNALFSSVISQSRFVLYEMAARHFF
jgi:hypothetical protein